MLTSGKKPMLDMNNPQDSLIIPLKNTLQCLKVTLALRHIERGDETHEGVLIATNHLDRLNSLASVLVLLDFIFRFFFVLFF